MIFDIPKGQSGEFRKSSERSEFNFRQR